MSAILPSNVPVPLPVFKEIVPLQLWNPAPVNHSLRVSIPEPPKQTKQETPKAHSVQDWIAERQARLQEAGKKLREEREARESQKSEFSYTYNYRA